MSTFNAIPILSVGKISIILNIRVGVNKIGDEVEVIVILLDCPISETFPLASIIKYLANTDVSVDVVDFAYKYNVQFPTGIISLFGSLLFVTNSNVSCITEGLMLTGTTVVVNVLTGVEPS